MASVLIRGTETPREGGHVKTEVGIVVMLPQAKQHLRLPKTGRGKGGCSRRNFKGRMALPGS